MHWRQSLKNTNVAKHLELIQGIISRMSYLSMACKLVATIIFIATLVTGGYTRHLLLLSIVYLWYIDDRYLQIERGFILFYEKIATQQYTDFRMIPDLASRRSSLANLLFYCLFLAPIIVEHILHALNS